MYRHPQPLPSQFTFTAFTISSPNFAAPTIDGNGGHYSAIISAVAPEPASLGLLALGASSLLLKKRRY